MKHRAHMNRFTALNTALTVSFAAFGLFAVSAAAAENYISISSDAGVQRPNYNNDGATDRFGMAIGVNTKATGHSGIAIGTSTTSAGESATAVGTLSNADGIAATAFGQGAQAVGNVTTAAGQKARATAQGATALGTGAVASAMYSTATGAASSASGQSSVAYGLQSKASANSAVAIGSRATASHDGSVALGAGSATAEAVGTNSATVNGVSYSGFAGTNPRSTVSVGYAGGERTITNVAAGRISTTSTDAINGSQLYQVAARSQGNSTAITNLQNQVNGIDNRSQGNSTAITNLQNQVNGIGNRLNDMDKDLRAGIAGATAIAFLQRPNEAGKSMVSAAVGGYRNEQAIAVGYAHNSDNNKWSVKTGVSVNTRKDVNWGGSVGYQW
ncbi:calcium-binding protein [Neisseria sicca]|uniref:Calcium-binding protein n=2 Tax=Neisseria sicca TaxID=490 RepID=A0A2I1XCE7_NEISI|nr:calcium-binding protein [Neisseria sicca]